ncbi:MAG: nucleoside 2-deoxyribosyltransferase, partial [Pseudomonas aeruginosa]|nr:nucleoside 2-deoxyribosyltransferase [Pseudomonas aeruginosa]
DGMTLEEFGLPLNLMLSVPGRIVVGDAEQALRQLASRRHG